ncbi:hypothetical protein ACQ4LE_003945 [Meloidogyne hapla]
MEDRPELNCFTLSCVCPIFNGKTDGSVNGCTLPNGKKLEKCVRKEFRMLTDEERQAYFNAVRHIKDNGAYDLCALQHKDAFNLKGAHRGPAFCPWHRELLKRYEILLREASFQTKQTPDVCLPYWDSTLERQLPTPKDSLLFTETFIGSTNSNNQVTNGPFYPWQTLEGADYITRTVGRDGTCYREEAITWELQQTNLTNFMAYFPFDERCQFDIDSRMPEIPHGTTHTFIGGLMRDARYAANDPIFFNHHCFVDLIWELYRQKQQTYAQRPVQYPPDIDVCEPRVHFRDSAMVAFAALKNIDGCRNEYTDNMYEYAPRPTCSADKPDCGSKYLFCDLSHGTLHCAAKVRQGGDCKGFTKGEQVCYNGACVNNVCVAQTVATESLTTTKKGPDTTPKVQTTTTKGQTTATKGQITTTKVQSTTTKGQITNTKGHSTNTKDPGTTKKDATTTTEDPEDHDGRSTDDNDDGDCEHNGKSKHGNGKSKHGNRKSKHGNGKSKHGKRNSKHDDRGCDHDNGRRKHDNGRRKHDNGRRKQRE